MFSLITSIIAVLLVIAVSWATVYYGGSDISNSGMRASVEQLFNAGEHLAAAGTLYQNDHAGTLPSSPSVGLAPDYLSSIPVPLQAVYASGAGKASASDWQYLPNTADIILPKLSLDACKAVNKIVDLSTIPPTLDAKHMIQCYGTKEPYTFYYDPPSGNLQTAAAIVAAMTCPSTPVTYPAETVADITVPGGCTQMTIKLWAGGGGAVPPTSPYPTNGTLYAGGGGYATGHLTVKGGDAFKIVVGAAGQSSGMAGGSIMRGGNGWGAGPHGGGSGGGGSALLTASSQVLLAAGGGGGAGTMANGGAGGGLSGTKGNAYYPSYNYNGTGGTQTAGGTCYFSYMGVCKGDYYSVGYGGDDYQAGAGGGGGYHGGGGSASGEGAGGGSSYVGGVGSGATLAASFNNPGNSADKDRQGAGQGGVAQGSSITPATGGIAVIYYAP